MSLLVFVIDLLGDHRELVVKYSILIMAMNRLTTLYSQRVRARFEAMKFFSPRLSQSPDSSSDFGNKLRSRCHKVIDNNREKLDQLIVNESQYLSGVFLQNNLFKMILDVQFKIRKNIF